MKKLIYALLIVILYASCQSKTTQQDDDTSKIVAPVANAAPELINTFKPIINGIWIKKDYIDKISKTKSPYAAKDLAEGITGMEIKVGSIKDDSLMVLVGWNNHDAGEMPLKFRKGKRPFTILLGGNDFGYEIKGKDTLLVLYYAEGNVNQTIKFIKAPNLSPDAGLQPGLDKLVNQVIITGTYILNDSLNVHNKVHFTTDGKVNGLSNFELYNLQTDFNSGPMNNMDEIAFDEYKKNQANFIFLINRDTLNIYETLANADSSELVLGTLKYKLVRKQER
ncbi:hypothetical protein GCM10023149_38810 [Mucilaginibacter gynuensis]|uniref:Lipocalin-like protein n=1 Tax=Mucilaginibacter gynuensis TaxID=1302236 RepID=A0ABP8H0Q5_9SPHI